MFLCLPSSSCMVTKAEVVLSRSVAMTEKPKCSSSSIVLSSIGSKVKQAVLLIGSAGENVLSDSSKLKSAMFEREQSSILNPCSNAFARRVVSY